MSSANVRSWLSKSFVQLDEADGKVQLFFPSQEGDSTYTSYLMPLVYALQQYIVPMQAVKMQFPSAELLPEGLSLDALLAVKTKMNFSGIYPQWEVDVTEADGGYFVEVQAPVWQGGEYVEIIFMLFTALMARVAEGKPVGYVESAVLLQQTHIAVTMRMDDQDVFSTMEDLPVSVKIWCGKFLSPMSREAAEKFRALLDKGR